MFKRIHLIVLDSVGIGAQPDAEQFGDVGAHTLKHTLEAHPVDLPNLSKLGLGCIEKLPGISCPESTTGFYSKMMEQSNGKDTMTGHWEIAGLNIQEAFKTYPEGFPPELIKKIEDYAGRKVVGNIPASGTEIIKDYGEHQMKTGDLIIYTSNDPVIQIAAHEEVIPLEELYDICDFVRKETLVGEYIVGRVIARPYVGQSKDTFERTSNRKDYALSPPAPTILDSLKDAGKDVIAIGKISDIFNTVGITQSVKTTSNEDGVDQLLNVMKQDFNGISFLNLVDFDAKFGHRRDPQGYSEALAEFDARLPEIIDALENDDLLILTADHGNDPTFHGTDHTREYVPLLITSKQNLDYRQLDDSQTFSDIAATIADNFKVELDTIGKSKLQEIIHEKK